MERKYICKISRGNVAGFMELTDAEIKYCYMNGIRVQIRERYRNAR